MKFYKNVDDRYIISISTGGGVEITEDEYNRIHEAIQNRPQRVDGYSRMLRDGTLEWEIVALPPVPEAPTLYTQESLETLTNAELETILYGYGITANMNKANMIRLILAAQGGDSIG